MPMFNAPGYAPSAAQPPMKRPYVPYSGQPQPALPTLPGSGAAMTPQMPMLPDPTAAATPPAIDPAMTANAAGGPAGPQSPIRAQAYTQLYKLGKQMHGPDNMFAGFDPNAATPRPDPLAGLVPGEPAPEQRQLPQLPPSTPAPPIQQASQQGQPMRPIDRFPRAARLMGRPQLPPPNGRPVGY